MIYLTYPITQGNLKDLIRNDLLFFQQFYSVFLYTFLIQQSQKDFYHHVSINLLGRYHLFLLKNQGLETGLQVLSKLFVTDNLNLDDTITALFRSFEAHNSLA